MALTECRFCGQGHVCHGDSRELLTAVDVAIDSFHAETETEFPLALLARVQRHLERENRRP